MFPLLPLGRHNRYPEVLIVTGLPVQNEQRQRTVSGGFQHFI